MIEYSDHFLKEVKQLAKKFKGIKSDLKLAVEEIENQNDLGVYLGYHIFKKRVPNRSIPTGKSGGFRVILYQKVEERTVLLSIYAKTQKETLSDDELRMVLQAYMEQ